MHAVAAGPLAGLPVAVKDNIDTADMPTERGSPIYRGHLPASDAPVVSMMLRAGGRTAGKTVTTEFAGGRPGNTTNPWNSDHTPGGSSSGSAAGVAAGFFPFALGTQTAGSIIRPAAFCGIAALKPSFNLLPSAGVKILSWTLDTVGLFAQNVRDVAFFTAALTGQNFTIATKDLAPRIGIARLDVWDQVSTEMMQALEDVCGRASRAGAKIKQVAVDTLFNRAQAAQLCIQEYESARSLAFEFGHWRDQFSRQLQSVMTRGWTTPAQTYRLAIDEARLARSAMQLLFDDTDILLAPSAASAAPRGLESTGSPNLTRLWTLLGVPCVNVPGLRNKAGMPLGIEVIAPLGQDHRALTFAAWLQDTIDASSE